MASLKNREIEDGHIIGTVKTSVVGSECTFVICTVSHWEALTEEEAEKLAMEALHESGMMEVWW